MEKEGVHTKKAPTTRTGTLGSDKFCRRDGLADDQLFSRKALKDYTDKHDRSSKKMLRKSYAPQPPDPPKEETEYNK